MQEVSSYGSSKKVRETFTIILRYCQPSEPKDLFDKVLDQLSDDFVYRETNALRCPRDDVDVNFIKKQVVFAIKDELSKWWTALHLC